MSFFGLAAVNDLQTEAKSENTVTKYKDLLFSVFAFPVGMVRKPLRFHTLLLNLKEELCSTLTPCHTLFFFFSLVCRHTVLDYFCL